MEIADTLAFLLGTWRLERSIGDRLTGTRLSFSGLASLTPAGPDEETEGEITPARARYEESGELVIGADYRGPATRTLDYARLGESGVMLYFATGLPFVDLDLRAGNWLGIHDCGADRYEIRTEVVTYDAIRERWRVRGPHKDYDAITSLTRLG
ncbi:MAG: DUF6314 family protein [Streptosporangiaceae bacterium]